VNIVDELLKIALFGSAWVLYLLLFLSMLSIGLMLERGWFFLRNSSRGDGLRTALLRHLQGNDADGALALLRDSKTVEGTVVANAFAFREGGGHAFSDALEAELSRARKELERGLTFLGTVGNNAPFIGLFGTVIGVIVAFHELGSAAARAGAMGSVMSGIAEALVATGVGLFVALPAVIAYNMMTKRIGDIEQETLALGRTVSAWLETHARGGVLRLSSEQLGGAAPGATPAAPDAEERLAVAQGGN
jgi:biopolymer transport protein ExbB/TolQ